MSYICFTFPFSKSNLKTSNKATAREEQARAPPTKGGDGIRVSDCGGKSLQRRPTPGLVPLVTPNAVGKGTTACPTLGGGHENGGRGGPGEGRRAGESGVVE